jgi:methylenetetrahydrofolate--tRNA-(uracil-5-)-methyltransferase
VKIVTVVGAGLAGCEAALQCARFGVPVRLHEMRPAVMTEAHQSGDVAELVCSNSLKSDEPQNAHGLLKAELRTFGSALLECAERARIPGGKALVVDRRRFSQEAQRALDTAGVEVVREEVETGFPSPLKGEGEGEGEPAITVIATGPLTSQPMAQALQNLLGTEHLFFYDAIAPIVAAESLDMNRVFEGSRYGAGSDYLNCPMSEDEYGRFVDALLGADLHSLHDFEKPVLEGLRHNPDSETARSRATKARKHEEVRAIGNRQSEIGNHKISGDSPRISSPFFEGCLPVEEIARRGRLALAFGPMKPVGLVDPRTGRRPFAVVQLRRENEAGTMYNLVGFQTRLTHPEQGRVFRLIPGLERAKFLRLGSIHRNTYLDAPRVLLPTLQTRRRADLFIAGQLAGVEGYVESIGAGLFAGINAARLAKGWQPFQLPVETMLGSLLRYIATPASDSSLECGSAVPALALPPGKAAAPQPQSKVFQPMNANYGLLPPFSDLGDSSRKRLRGRDKRRAMAERALARAREFASTIPCSPA